jgi:hypothetical protein
MKKALLIFILLITGLNAFAQEFLHDGGNSNETRNLILKNPKAGFSFCQVNQNILYDKIIENSHQQIAELLEIIDHEYRISPESRKLKLYNALLLKLVLKDIWYGQMKKQLATKSLYLRFLAANKTNSELLLGLENINVDLPTEMIKSIDQSLLLKGITIYGLRYIRRQLLIETLSQIVSGSFKFVITHEGVAAISSLLAGTVTAEAFTKASTIVGLNLSKAILTSVAKGAIITILTLPLHGYTSSPVQQWMDLLELAPELILNPDARDLGKSRFDRRGALSALNWETHCLAMVRNTSQMEFHFNKLVEKNNDLFHDQLNFIINISNLVIPNREYSEIKIDKTYVKKNRIL